MTAPAVNACSHDRSRTLPDAFLAEVLGRSYPLADRFGWCPECGTVWYRWPLSGRLEVVGVVQGGAIKVRES